MSSVYREINLSYLESIADGDQGIINELIIIFLDQIPEFTEGFQESFNNKNWKNLELIAKTFRIKELEKSGILEDKEREELKNLLQSLHNYPDEKQAWISENSNEEMMDSIIKKFLSTSHIACDELKTVLEN